MGKALIIAEKPSVASDIAKALGGFTKKDDMFESDKFVLSSAVGHLLELCLPEGVEVKRGKWTFAHLPVIPDHFDLRPIEKSTPRLNILLRALKRKDVDRLINACDAGREGELIFRYIVQHAKAKQPIQRLWLQSMTPAAIREGFTALREGTTMQPLADAAVCRSESDWLVGINGTRAMTAFNSKTGGFQLTTVGRVQTPTLAIVVEREEKIKNFVPRDYCELHATFAAKAGQYVGRWFDENFSREKRDNDQAGGSRFSGGDFVDLTSLARKLSEKPDALSAFLNQKLDANVKTLLPAYQPSRTTYLPLDVLLAKNLNTIVSGAAIYDEKRFQNVRLRRETDELLKKKPEGQDLIRLNRMLLEDAYPLELSRTSTDLKPERIWDRKKAEAILQKCQGQPGIVTEETKPSSQLSPLLYDLTSLQRDANSRIGFSAKNTLGLAQGLYERHKVLTYPRTDARALPEDYIPTVKKTLQMLGDTPYARFAGEILQKQWVRADKRIFNNAKISDHFAIIPTSIEPKNLNEAEQKLYDMVTKRFLAVFYPAAEFLVSTRITHVKEEAYKTEGKVMVQAGWMSVYGKEAQTEDQTPRLVPVQANETVHTEKIDLIATQTKPPARYTEATLLHAMETAGKLVEDEELREAMGQKGLGTPATRAAVIEGLLYEKYLLRNLRELQPTPKAFSLITLLRGLDIPELSSPELTGNWEFKLRQMEHGELGRPEFMRQIEEMTRSIVAKTKGHESDTVPGDFGELKSPCPKCGGVIKENYKKFQCQKCDFALWKIVAGRQMEIAEADELITKRVIGPLQGFRSKMGRPFAAIIKLTADLKPEFDFGQQDAQDDAAAAALDFTGREPFGKCPSCGSPVYEDGMNYICEKAARRQGCAFRTGKVILQRPIEPEQVKKLLATGRTDLLDKFISKKGRPFKAFLVVGEGGKVGFEFEPRAPKGTGAAKTKTPAPKIDLTGAEPVGKCPVCGSRVLQTDGVYICEKSQAEKKPCKFKVDRTVAGQPVERDQLEKLLKDGRTDLLTKFISKRGLPFSAFLVLDDDNKVTFEFLPRDN